jgi:hypothetical protein
MKTTTIIQQYKKESVIGTKTSKEVKSFFGSNLIDIEDEIVISDISIQYSDTPTDHYQYYDLTTLVNEQEVSTLRSLDDIKFENHTIDLYRQNYTTSYDNLQWNYVVKARNILKEYLFCRLKEARTMKAIRKEQTPKNDINTFLYDYIEFNLLDRYNINYITFYIKYRNVLDDGNTFNNNYTIKNPTFNKTAYKNENITKDVRVLTTDYLNNLGDVNMVYNQIKNAIQYTFDYYFVVSYKKI